MDIGAWLRGLGLERYEEAFHAEAIDVEVLPELTEAGLEKLRIPLGHLPGQDTERARRHLERLSLPLRPADLGLGPFPTDDLLAAMGRDKKVQGARLRFILLRRIGDAFISADVPEAAVREILADT